MNKFVKWIGGVALLTLFALAPPIPCGAMDAEDAPDDVDIDVMPNLFKKVEFPHSVHVDITEGDCTVCHHHTAGGTVKNPNCVRCHANSGEQDVVACRDCHPLDRFSQEYLKSLEKPLLYHINKPGLKGAYHLNCRGCHVEMDGPTGCEDCHAMTDAGKKFYHTGKYAPPHKKKKKHH